MQTNINNLYIRQVIESCNRPVHVETTHNWISRIKTLSWTDKAELLRKLQDRENFLLKLAKY